jgi:glycosyltransferase involved in cell wall biosynthesis
MPIAILESLAAGRPVIATDVDGVREILAEGGGFLVPPGSPTRTAVALHELLTEPEMRRLTGRAGRTAILRRHDAHALMKAYDELVRTHLVGGRR